MLILHWDIIMLSFHLIYVPILSLWVCGSPIPQEALHHSGTYSHKVSWPVVHVEGRPYVWRLQLVYVYILSAYMLWVCRQAKRRLKMHNTSDVCIPDQTELVQCYLFWGVCVTVISCTTATTVSTIFLLSTDMAIQQSTTPVGYRWW